MQHYPDHRSTPSPRKGRKVLAWVKGLRTRLLLESMEDRLVPSTFNVNSTADILNPMTGVVTLRSAIQAANATPGGNTINLTVPGTYQITLPGTPGETDNAAGEFAILPGGGDLNIVNTSGGSVVVDANHLSRVFDINPNFNPNNPPPRFTVTLQGFTIQNGLAVDQANPDGPNASGGGIRDQGNASLTLTNVVVTNNTATADGGGVSMENTVSTPWTLTVNSSTISNNHAGDAGGGIEEDGSGHVVINAGTVITGNTSVNQGAGIWLDGIQVGTVFQGATLSVTGTIISNNSAIAMGTVGGGIGNAGNGAVTVSTSTIANNFSNGNGGGFADENNQGTLTVMNSLFIGNSAIGDGGAIQEGGATTMITNTEIKGNASSAAGGGLFISGTTLTLAASTLAGNTTTGNGGGLDLMTTGNGGTGSTITNTTITGNGALNSGGGTAGGGIYAPSAFTGSVLLLNDTINANFATTQGGGVFWAGAGASMFGVQNTIIAGNVGGTGPDANNPAGTFTDNGGNLIGISGAGSGNTGFGANTTQTGTTANPLNPVLGVLQNNGGPTVGATGNSLTLETVALLPGSPAVGKGITTGAPTTDERGFPRIVNGRIDVGAFEVQPAATTTTLTSSLNPAPVGQAVTFTATVSVVAPATGTPTGMVTFLDGTTTLGTATLTNGVATLTTSALSAGTHSITAMYNGTTQGAFTFMASTSMPVMEMIVQPVVATTTVLASSLNPARPGQAVTFTATVSATMPGSGTPTGMVTFLDGTTSIGTATLTNGVATLTTSTLAPGKHSITAMYNGITQGGTTFSPSTSAAVVETIRFSYFAVGGSPGRVQVRRDSDGSLVADFAPYGANYTGAVTVAVGDVNGDGVPDLVTGAAVGNPDVRVFDGLALENGTFNPANPNASLLAQFFPYALQFNVGANVAVGDIEKDGFADIVTGATVGNPDVRVYSGKDIANHTFNPNGASMLAQWFPYGLQFNIGANVAVGDVNGDGFADVVTGATAGNPDVRVYNGKDIALHTFNPTGTSQLAQFFAFGLQFNIGAFVAVGDTNGDGFGDVIVGATSGNPQVKVYDGKAIANGSFQPANPDNSLLDQFFAFNSFNANVGVSVAAADFEGTGMFDILTGSTQGPGHYRVVKGNATGILPPAVNGIDMVLTDITGGLFVGA